MGDEQSGGEVESVGDGSEEHLSFDGETAGRGVGSREDEGDVGDCHVGWANGSESGLFVDEGKDGHEGVGGREEDKEEQAHLQRFLFRVKLQFRHQQQKM